MRRIICNPACQSPVVTHATHFRNMNPLFTRLLLASMLVGTGLNLVQAAAPDQNIFNVRSFGAVGDGKNLDSPAINQAIDAAVAVGGGTVLLPAGTYLSG